MRPAIQEEEELKMGEDNEHQEKYMDSSMYKAARVGNFTALMNSIRQKNEGYIDEAALLDHLKLETRKGNNLAHVAAESGHEDFIQQVLRKCPQLADKTNSCGDTPLHVAARTRRFKSQRGGSDIVEAILSKDTPRKDTPTTDTPCTRQMKRMEDGGAARINNSLLRMENSAGNTALHEALRTGNEELGMLLWEKDKEMVGSVNEAGESTLYVAAEFGFERVVKEMVEFLKGSVQREGRVWHEALRGPDLRNPLHAAVLAGSIGCVDALIKLQEPNMINAIDKDGRTALHFAAKAEGEEIATRLLGTDPSSAYTKDLRHGRTPLLEAASSGNLRTLIEILKHCPDSGEITDDEGRNAIHLALKCKLNYAKKVLEVPPLVKLVNKADNRQDTPLHMAAKDHNYKMVKKLLMNDEVDLRAKNADGLTFLDICESLWQYSKTKAYLYRHLKHLPAHRKPPTANLCTNHLTPIDKPKADLKGHANALSIVATLLATITFAAAFTLPGGFTPDDTGANPPLPSPLCNFQNSPDHPPPMISNRQSSHEDGRLKGGHAILIDRVSFKIFILADAVAVSTSLTVIFILISAMLANETVLRRAIVYSKKLLCLSLGGTVLAFVTGLYAVIWTDVSWLAISVCVIGLSIPFLIQYLLFKSFTSTPVFLHRFFSKRSSEKRMEEQPSRSSPNESVVEPDSFDDASGRNEVPCMQLRQGKLNRRNSSRSK